MIDPGTPIPVRPEATPGSTGPSSGNPAVPAKDPVNPVVERTRELLAAGDVRSAIRVAYRSAFRDAVRAYALNVPVSCTDRRFLSGYLRPDMGKLATLLPELYRWYEPVRYGLSVPRDTSASLALLERLYTETSLGVIYRPHYQPTGPETPSPFASWPYRPASESSPP